LAESRFFGHEENSSTTVEERRFNAAYAIENLAGFSPSPA